MLRTKAIGHLRAALAFIILSFIVTQGPLGATGAMTIDVWSAYKGPDSFLIPSEYPVILDFENYFGDAWNVSGWGTGLLMVSDGSRLVVFAQELVGESNVTIAVRTPYGMMSRTVPFLVYPNLDRATIRDHNAPSWMRR